MEVFHSPKSQILAKVQLKYVKVGEIQTCIWEWIESSADEDGSFPHGNMSRIYLLEVERKWMQVRGSTWELCLHLRVYGSFSER